MLFCRGLSRISRNLRCSLNGFPFFPSIRDQNHQFLSSHNYQSPRGSTAKVTRSLILLKGLPALHSGRYQIHHQSSSISEDELDPFSLVADELSLVANKLRAMVVAEVPKLASGAEYFFKLGVEGKRFRPTVLLLMSTALNLPIPKPPLPDDLGGTLSTDLRSRQQCIAEITEMIHVASLLHDDVLDDAETRRGVGSLNFVMGNKLAVLAGDFLLSRACVALASLKNTEVVSLLATVVEHLVTGETMQMTTSSDQSMEYYMQKTYYKTASLISNSCKAIAILAGHTADVAMLAFDYGKNLGLAFQLIDDVLDFTGTSASLGKGSLSDIRHGIVTAPILFAMEEFPQLRAVIDEGLDNPENVDLALEYLGKSRGIHRTRELAIKHANLAAAAIDSLPESDDEEVKISRRALVDLTQRVITRTK
ncbi:solanesyl diphosphate synthase 3, chloroplastic/mitochondrial-like isoform X2 [Gastrolobium bilobum]|uniref:solanesyl diphosphate synthase 3, chloroplastic/mitochondrial-like isoform X2 n=1 Tax=Gastrolobium bilobum TaxID=150636 RepID=UPI002AB2DBEF|nr:solanesyl diphosphate synthase 3, chloroplastic/mitochondrial-like isoform X2 [Gastrolobium bilobum]